MVDWWLCGVDAPWRRPRQTFNPIIATLDGVVYIMVIYVLRLSDTNIYYVAKSSWLEDT